jgi:hypothetical protein
VGSDRMTRERYKKLIKARKQQKITAAIGTATVIISFITALINLISTLWL